MAPLGSVSWDVLSLGMTGGLIQPPSSGSAAWSPSDLPAGLLRLHYDPSDSANVTSSGGVASQLNDLSSNADHLTASGSSRPGDSGSINGLTALDFDGSDDFMENTSLSSTITDDDQYFFCVLTVSNGSEANGHIAIGTNAANDNPNTGTDRIVYARRSSTTTNVVSRRNNAQGANVSFSYDTPFLMECRVDANDGIVLHKNGSKTGATVPLAQTGSFAIDQFRVGVHIDPGSNHDGLIGEMILVEGQLTYRMRQRIEGYLAHKWGLSGDLPAWHPYKLAAPLVNDPWVPTDLLNCRLWYDPNNADTVTSAANLISQIDDQTDNMDDLVQVGGSEQPRDDGSMNTLTVMDFDGSDDNLECVLGTNITDSDLLFIGALTITNSGDSTSRPVSTTDTSLNVDGANSNIISPIRQSGMSDAVLLQRNSSSTTTLSPGFDTPFVFMAETDATSGSRLSINAGTPTAYVDAAGGAFNIDQYVLGGRAGNATLNNHDGLIGPQIVIAGTFTTTDIELLEGYLFNATGISLPSGHTYENAAPTIQDI